MSYTEQEFKVKLILKKRLKNGKVEYLLKRDGYTSECNEWIPLEMMQCPDLVRYFETSRFVSIIGVKTSGDGTEYAIKLKGQTAPFELMRSRYVLDMWPNALIGFLEGRIAFQMPVASEHAPLALTENVVGVPNQIIGCTDFGGELKYLCKWDSQPTLKLVSSVDAKAHFPHLVVGYLEQNLLCTQFQFPNAIPFMTRPMKRAAERENISIDSKIMISRNLGLEKTLFQNPRRIIQHRNTGAVLTNDPTTTAAHIVQRRNTVVGGPANVSTAASSTNHPTDQQQRATNRVTTLKKITAIPFGARGRGRSTNVVMFISLKPNLDGHAHKNDLPLK